MAKAMISAFDAVLDAEREAGLVGPGINFTATFSYALCPACGELGRRPALGQMALLRDAMNNPAKYSYVAHNNLAEAYRTRWINSFNTANSAKDLQQQFFTDYVNAFVMTPVFIGEYHNPKGESLSDLSEVLAMANGIELFYGISFFEYQAPHIKLARPRTRTCTEQQAKKH